MGKRVLVTGGAGFLGSHLVEQLIHRGDEVVAVDNCVTGNWTNLAHLGAHPRLTRVDADVSKSIPVEVPVEQIFHFASPASPKDFVPLGLEIMDVNSNGLRNCLDIAVQCGATVVFASTSEVYGDPLVSPQPETYWGNVNPNGIRSVYDESKRFGEALMMAYRRRHGVNTRILRFFNTFGPRMRQDDGRVVPNFIIQALRNEPITIYGSGDQTRSFGYCLDSIRGAMALADSDVIDPVNIGAEFEMSIRSFAELVIDLTGSSSEIIRLPAVPDDPQQRCPDLTRARTLLGYSPQTTLEHGLYATIEHFRSAINQKVQTATGTHG